MDEQSCKWWQESRIDRGQGASSRWGRRAKSGASMPMQKGPLCTCEGRFWAYKTNVRRLTMGNCSKQSHLYIPRKGNSAASVSISSFMCLWMIYIFPGSIHTFSCSRIGRMIVGYVNHSQTHECGNWDWGRPIPFVGIFVSNFRYSAFAVQDQGTNNQCKYCCRYCTYTDWWVTPMYDVCVEKIFKMLILSPKLQNNWNAGNRILKVRSNNLHSLSSHSLLLKLLETPLLASSREAVLISPAFCLCKQREGGWEGVVL